MRRAAANSLKAKPKKTSTRMSARQVEVMNDKYLGEEPEFGEGVISQVEYIRALNWYSSRIEIDDAKLYLNEYLEEHNPKLIKAVRKIPETKFNKSMCWIARMRANGIMLPEDANAKFDAFLDELAKIQSTPTPKTAENDNASSTDRLGVWMPDFEEALDKLSPDFDTYQYLTNNNVPRIYVTRIAEYYQRILNEVTLALTKQDPQVVEAYKHMKKTDIAFLGKYLLNIIDDCSRFVSNNKKERAPKKIKAKTSDQLLKHFAYLEKDDRLKIISSDPKNIFGAEQLFAFNVAYNILTLYVAKEGGLGVHRTAITNYDEAKSFSKRVGKKSQEVIDTILKGSKKARESVFNLSNTDYIKVGDRINTNTVLLKIVK